MGLMEILNLNPLILRGPTPSMADLGGYWSRAARWPTRDGGVSEQKPSKRRGAGFRTSLKKKEGNIQQPTEVVSVKTWKQLKTYERLLEVWLLYGFEKASVRTIICVGGLFIPDKLWRLLRKQTKCPLNPMLDTYSPFKRSNHTGFETTPSRILLNLPFSLTKNDAPPVAATGVAGKGLQSRFSYLASGCDFFFAIPARLSYSSLGVFLTYGTCFLQHLLPLCVILMPRSNWNHTYWKWTQWILIFVYT